MSQEANVNKIGTIDLEIMFPETQIAEALDSWCIKVPELKNGQVEGLGNIEAKGHEVIVKRSGQGLLVVIKFIPDYFVEIRNEKRGLSIKIEGEAAKIAYKNLNDSVSSGVHFEWGGMIIDTWDDDWKYRDSNTLSAPGLEPWFSFTN